MALENPAYVIQVASHNASLFRLAAQTLLGGAGVIGAGDLQVTQNATPNMSVNVAAGMVWIPGTLGSGAGMPANVNAQTAFGLPSGLTAQGAYAAYQDATVNLPLLAADPANPRYDIVCASIQDAQYAGTTNQPVLSIVTGNPAPSPAFPAAPASTVVCAAVYVPAGATSIVTGYITDVRPLVKIPATMVPATITYKDTGNANITSNANPGTSVNGRAITNPFGTGVPFRVKVSYQNGQVDSSGVAQFSIVSPSLSATKLATGKVNPAPGSVAIIAEVDMPSGGSVSFSGRYEVNSGTITTYADPLTHFMLYEVSPL